MTNALYYGNRYDLYSLVALNIIAIFGFSQDDYRRRLFSSPALRLLPAPSREPPGDRLASV